MCQPLAGHRRELRDLPADFQILVPKNLCKLYRTKWQQYADHINPDLSSYAGADILAVTTTEPNTLAEQLGLTVTYDQRLLSPKIGGEPSRFINSVRGDYSEIHRLKVTGPISGADLSLLRYLAGFCPWSNDRNYQGRLEYIDLYDAQIVKSNYEAASDMYWDPRAYTLYTTVETDNVLPPYSFLQAYSLKTLILPRTLTKIETRAMQQCENLETLVIGDETTDFNWSALDDDVNLTRLYLLSKQKPALDMDSWAWRNLCNNYHPTFDAFYVRPSLYDDYLNDDAYTGQTWQRTNSITAGAFTDDESFCAFAAHAAATEDDLLDVDNVEGWFDSHTGIRDLTPLRHTTVDSLSTATLQPLTQLERIAMPATLTALGDSIFNNAAGLRYVDFLLCDSTDIAARVKAIGLKQLGIDTGRTLVYLPAAYGQTDETNVVVPVASQAGTAAGLKAQTFRLVDGKDYCVPYSFEAHQIENTRVLAKDAVPYSVCLPYTIDVPQYSRAYKLTEREDQTLIFAELEKGERLEALHPYLVKVVGDKRFRKNATSLNTAISQTIPANSASTRGQQVDVAGYSLRGTLDAIDNQTAADMGAYILQSDGDWHPVTTAQPTATILPFRAFLLPSTRTAGSRIAMLLEDNDANGIETIETIDRDGTHHYYDLNGREVNRNAKGLIINNGKKVLNK